VFKCEVIERLKRVEAKLDQILQQEQTMSKELDALTTQVKQNTDLEQSAVTLIKGLADQIAAAKDDPVRIDALTQELKTKADALAQAITANTPPAPTP
jgi:predicted  nucleic acid-binding Zn-ribbon protein